VHRHYGHAGPAFVEHLLRDIQRIDDWRRTYLQLATDYAKRAGPNPVAGRLAKNLALLELTAQIAADAGVVPWTAEEMLRSIEAIWETVIGRAEEADVDRRALQDILSWAGRHESAFVRGLDDNEEQKEPWEGWAGRWCPYEGWDDIAFFPDKLERLLRDFGYSPEATLAAWRDRGWMETGKGRRTKQVRVWGQVHYLYVIRRSAVEEVAPGLGEKKPLRGDDGASDDTDDSSDDKSASPRC